MAIGAEPACEVRNGMAKIRTSDPHIQVTFTDLRKLVWWAAIGVQSSTGGMYARDIEDIIEWYGQAANVPFDGPIRFQGNGRFRKGTARPVAATKDQS
jgi:hypothetical protein